MLVFNVTFNCKPGRRERFLQAIRAEGIDAACRAEAGNLGYAYYLSAENGDDLLLIEKWADAEALASHARQPHMARMDELKAEHARDMVIEMYRAEK